MRVLQEFPNQNKPVGRVLNDYSGSQNNSGSNGFFGNVGKKVGDFFKNPLAASAAKTVAPFAANAVDLGSKVANNAKPIGKFLAPVAFDIGKNAPKKNPEQIAGDVLDTGTNLALAGSMFLGNEAAPAEAPIADAAVKSVVKEVPSIVNKGIEALKSLKTAGTGYGAAQGLATSLKNEASPGKTVANTILGGVIGRSAEFLGGKAINAITKEGGIFGKTAQELEKRSKEFLTPEMTAKKSGEAIAQGRGTIEKGTIFDKVKISPDSKINKAYEAVKGILDPSKTYTENINNIRKALSDEAEFLKEKIKNVVTKFKFSDLESKLRGVELPISFKRSATNQDKILEDIITKVMKISQSGEESVAGGLDARKEFDALVKENFPNLYENGKPTDTYYAVTRVRNAFNDYIQEVLPDGFGYRESLGKQSGMYDAIDSMESSAGKEVGQPTNKIIRSVKNWEKRNPQKAGALKLGSSLTGGYLLNKIFSKK